MNIVQSLFEFISIPEILYFFYTFYMSRLFKLKLIHSDIFICQWDNLHHPNQLIYFLNNATLDHTAQGIFIILFKQISIVK